MSDISIDAIYCGPPNSGNGGYCCGRFAQQLGVDPAEGVEVTLHKPPPLDQALSVHSVPPGIEIRDAGDLVARAVPTVFDFEPLPAPDPLAAREAEARYTGFSDHPFSGCFVCGPDRAVGDGLRLFPGLLTAAGEQKSSVACCWQPFAALADAQGFVRPEFIWAALDCPTYFGAFAGEANAIALLGRQALRCLHTQLPADRAYLVRSWLLARDGRKRHSAGALYTEEGQCVALSRATWIVL